MGHTGLDYPKVEEQSVTAIAGYSNCTRPLVNWVPSGPWNPWSGSVSVSRRSRDRPVSVHNAVKHGWRNPSSYYFRDELNIPPRVRVMTRDQYWYGTEYAPVLPGWARALPGFVWPVPAWTRNMALIKARNDLRNVNAQLGVALLEHKKTGQLVLSKTRQVTHAIMSFKRGKPTHALRELFSRPTRKDWRKTLSPKAKAIASEWLQLEYGLMPTLHDIQGAVDGLAQYDKGNVDENGRILMVNVKKSHVDKSYRDKKVRWSAAHDGNWGVMANETLIRGSTVRLDYWVDAPLSRTMSELGMVNPASIAWEVVPFSFIVDWFWPLGAWFESLDATAGLTFRSGTWTDWVEYSLRCNGETDDTTALPNQSRLEYVGGGVQRVKRMERGVYYNSPVPFPPLPGQGSFLGVGKRGVNAIALLVNALPR